MVLFEIVLLTFARHGFRGFTGLKQLTGAILFSLRLLLVKHRYVRKPFTGVEANISYKTGTGTTFVIGVIDREMETIIGISLF